MSSFSLLELNHQQITEDEAYYLTLGDGIIHLTGSVTVAMAFPDANHGSMVLEYGYLATYKTGQFLG
jgi:hypothetical protein